MILHVAVDPKRAIAAPEFKRNFKYKGKFVGNSYAEYVEHNNKSARVENKLYPETISTIQKIAESSGFVLKKVIEAGTSPSSPSSSLFQVWVKSDFPLLSSS